MVSKKPFKAYKCTNLPIKNPWLPKASPPSKKTKCTYLGERYAGPFGESSDNFHLFYEFLPKLSGGAAHNCVLN